ncbi:MAG: hypothetical protein ACI8UO_000738 [Verrucomicrobiales bacterium]
MNLRVTQQGEWDLELRAEFWEKRQASLGREYLLHLRSELKRLTRLATSDRHARRLGDFRRFLTKRFSAEVFYDIEDDDLVVYGVFDCREDPLEIELELSRR